MHRVAPPPRAQRRAAPKRARALPSGEWPMYSSVEGSSSRKRARALPPGEWPTYSSVEGSS